MSFYCYDILSTDIDKDKIRDLVESIFYNKKFGDVFDKKEKVPIDIGVSLLWKRHRQVCLDIKTKSKLIKKRISKILNKLTSTDLVWKGLSLKKPSVDECDLERFKTGKGEKRWDTLEHNGPYFKHLSEPNADRLDVNLIYDGKQYPLNEKEERVAALYAKRIITEEKSTKKYLKVKEFTTNFFKDFKTYLTPEHRKLFTDFKKLDFTLLVNRIKEIKEKKDEEKRLRREEKAKHKGKKEENPEEQLVKKQERIQKLEKKLDYSYAFVDGMKKDIRNSAVEMQGLYIGAGNNMTHKGRIKPLYYPEDITINTSKGKEPTPPKGHKWGKIVNDNTGNWTARYKDKISDKYKYILLSETGDLLKFEKARKLNKHIDIIDEHIEHLLKSKSVKDNQIGCALYLIKEYGIRVGNECEEDECDTKEKVVGATTLMIQNVSCQDPEDGFHIDLSFKGKDSVSYDNTLEVSEEVYKKIKSFMKGKSDDDKLFDKITSSDVNKYLKSIDKDFSAKVFRTRLASSIMHEGLQKLEYNNKATDQQKIDDFDKVNLQVAIKLNHKKGLTDAAKEKFKKDKEKLNELKAKVKDEKDKDKKKKLQDEYKKKERLFAKQNELKEVALDTSKKNYIDPRIVKAWAERVNLGGCKDEEDEDEEEDEEVVKHCVDKVYTNAHLKTFRWAIEDDKVDEEWDYIDTDLECMNEELTPEVDKEVKEKKIEKKIDTEHLQKCVKKVAKEFGKTEKEVMKIAKTLI